MIDITESFERTAGTEPEGGCGQHGADGPGGSPFQG